MGEPPGSRLAHSSGLLILIGQKLSHYSVLEKLGEGGMGEVYLAEDLELKRSVALKILPPELASDPERLARFRREAESLAAISHPNIVTIFSIEHVGNLHILTMERVEGRSLDELMPEEGMPLDQLLDIGVALSGALAAAHEKGITHRDLKPANLMVTEDGRLKVLDFGLAKLQREAQSQVSQTQESLMVTREATIIGTVPYMSPEQIENKPVDGRSDIFCSGIVLYELATGRRPFQGDSMASVMSSILKEEPRPASELRRDLPRELDRILSRCLKKDPAERYQAVSELEGDLQLLSKSPTHWPRALHRLLAAVLVLAVGLLTWQWFFGPSDADPPAIAVMTFKHTGATDDAYQTSGMRSQIANLLQPLGMRVVHPHSTVRYETMPTAQIGEELSVGYLLYGTVLWVESDKERRVVITPLLMRVRDGDTLSMPTFDKKIRNIDDVFQLQRDIVIDVTTCLGVTLTAEQRDSIGSKPTNNLEAFNLYQRGLFLQEKRTEATTAEALKFYQQAIRLDPNYARALIGMARVWGVRWWYCVEAPAVAYPKNKVWLDKAFQADNKLPEAWAHRANNLLNYNLDYKRAEEAYLTAIRLGEEQRGGFANAHHWYGFLLSALDRPDEAVAQSRIAERLDPVSPIIPTWLGMRYYFIGKYDEAVRHIDRGLVFDKEFPPGHWHKAWPLSLLGRHEEAIASASRAYANAKNPLYLTTLAWAHARAGDHKRARQLLSELEDLAKKRYVSSYHLATIHVALDEKDQAFVRLNLAFKQRDGWRYQLKMDPRFAPLRGDPRFVLLVRLLGF